jgi:PAS domain S-box-containing protein
MAEERVMPSETQDDLTESDSGCAENLRLGEIALQESEQRFRDLADKAPVAVYLLENGVAKYINQRFAEMHGYSVEELLNKNTLRTLVHPDDWEQTERFAVERLERGPGSRSKGSFRGLAKNGDIIFIETHSTVTMYHGRPAIIGMGIDVTEQKNLEKELRSYRDLLERLVDERTAQFNEANAELREDIARREAVESELEAKSESLQEANIALKVLLKQREEDRRDLEEKVSSNVKELVLRYTEMLRETHLDEKQTMLLDAVEANLGTIVSPFSKRIGSFNLTPREMEVLTLIKDGRTSKQIASMLNTSMDAISQHRYQIRRKLGLNKIKTGLRSHLIALNGQ